MPSHFGTVISILCCAALLACTGARAAEPSLDELNRESQNPVADLISLPLQNNTNFDLGPHNRTQNIFNIQPVIPFHLSKSWNLITRTIAPLTYQPDLASSSGGTWGLGDINSTLFFAPAKPGKIMWGAGPIFQVPSATDDSLGEDKWGAGASGVVIIQPGNWTFGALASNTWSFAGDQDRNDINRFLLQYFVVYNLPNQWSLTASPSVTANWEADSGDRWTVPIGGGVAKLVTIGKLPVSLQVQAFYNIERPEWGPDWTLRLQVQFLLPKWN